MQDFNDMSFELDQFKTWISWNDYDLSAEWLKEIRKSELIDLLSNATFSLQDTDLQNFSKEELLTQLNQSLLKFHSPGNFELFWIKDPRDTELSTEEQDLYTEKNFPKTILTLLTHGTYWVPSIVRGGEIGIRKDIKENIDNILLPNEIEWSQKMSYSKIMRILKNYSDFWTRSLVKKSFIPRDQVLSATNSRLVWDPARPIKADTFIQEQDFYKNTILKNPEEFRKIWEESHTKYHLSIEKKSQAIITEQGWVIMIDDHDTGVLDMWTEEWNDKYDDWWFPLMTLWTMVWESCNPEILAYYAERIEHHLWIKPLINKPYKWGYVTQKHWVAARKKLESEWKDPGTTNVIQQELAKFLYLDEKTQKIDHDKAELIWIGLARAKADLWSKFWKEYFEAWKFWNKYEETTE
jgi:N-formylglutamate amidohydrolase